MCAFTVHCGSQRSTLGVGWSLSSTWLRPSSFCYLLMYSKLPGPLASRRFCLHLSSQHKDLSSVPKKPHEKVGCGLFLQPRDGEADRILEACWPAGVAQPVSSRCMERLGLSKMEKRLSATDGHMHRYMLLCAYMHECTHALTFPTALALT